MLNNLDLQLKPPVFKFVSNSNIQNKLIKNSLSLSSAEERVVKQF